LQRRNRNRGKDGERRFAKLFSFLGGKRVGLFGDEDVRLKGFSGETKVVTSFVGRKWLDQATRNNLNSNGRDTTKLPLVGVAVKGSPKWITMMWADDFIKILKKNIALRKKVKELETELRVFRRMT
jgi:hypothetical protein